MDKRIDPASFLYVGNQAYLTDLFRKFIDQPDQIPENWRGLLNESDAPSAAFLAQGHQRRNAIRQDTQAIADSIHALMLIRAHRVRGHLVATLDPLDLEKPKPHPDLELETYGFRTTDLDRTIYIDGQLGFTTATLRQIVEKLQQTYCSTIGVEFMHIQDPEQREWIQNRFEQGRSQPSPEQQREILSHLLRAEAFENFLHVKFPGAKRFGLDGGESLIPALNALLTRVTHNDVKEIVIGMTHRGRLNVLANILHKPKSQIFMQFREEVEVADDFDGSGDVKYHIGYSNDRSFGEKSLHLSLTPNPSHLEAVNAVVLGKVRAKQQMYGDERHVQVMGLLLHGDAAFAGQGLAAETLELSGLRGYRTGGTLHVIVNNQIGFTTSPPHSRSSPYSSDLGKAIQAPIIHVNGDDPEAVVWAMGVAEDFRLQFAQDVILDLVCYRRHGHNEGDEPSFTQPLMYQAIAKHPSTATLYREHLLTAQVIQPQDLDNLMATIHAELQAEFDKAPGPLKTDGMKGIWSGITPSKKKLSAITTGVEQKLLIKLGQEVMTVPADFHIHPKIARQLEAKKKILETGKDLDWTTAETLAFSSLLHEKIPVRLSGQDSGRGTFSQRHAVWVDQTNENKHIPLSHLARQHKTFFEIVDSPLAEASVLAYEYGYSSSNPMALVLWEAQFGDFANGAQVIIDQFIASGEAKWSRLSGLVMLLPHGFEGQGPEHSSARLERYLQLCGDDNLRVANCSTPANYFHALRRQVRKSYRKPLILMTPKSLLRHPRAVSSLSDMAEGTTFLSVIVDESVTPESARRVVLCSGKVYYDLLLEREKRALKDIALIRLEQFYPFPEAELIKALKPFQQADVIWCQEEPLNMGGWTFVDHRFEALLKSIDMNASHWRPVGRPIAASPATGLHDRHVFEQNKLVDEALTFKKDKFHG